MKTLFQYFLINILFVSASYSQWTQANGPGTGVRKFLFSNSNIYAGTYSGVFVSLNNGDDWTPIGLSTERISSLIQVGSALFASSFDNGIFFSSNNGAVWEQRNNGITAISFRCLFSNQFGIFAGTFGGGIYYSSNNGIEWNKRNLDSSVDFTSFVTSNGIQLYAGAITGLYKSNDNGMTWNNIGFNTSIFRFLINGTDIFVPVGNGMLNNTTLYVSHNDGLTWEPLLTINDGISDIISAGGYLFFSTINGHGVYRSSDNGLTWTQFNDGFNIIPIVDCVGVHDNYIFAGASNAWRRILESPLPVEISSFTSSVSLNDVLLKWSTTSETNNSGFEIQRGKYVEKMPVEWSKVAFINGSGTSNSHHDYELTDKNVKPARYVYRLKQLDFNGNFEYFYLPDEVQIALPERSKLSQNYPNPFNPKTVVDFDLVHAGFVKLNIYGIDGKQILSLINNLMNPGSYSLNIDSNGLSSGTYFYSLNIDGTDVDVKRMILLK